LSRASSSVRGSTAQHSGTKSKEHNKARTRERRREFMGEEFMFKDSFVKRGRWLQIKMGRCSFESMAFLQQALTQGDGAWLVDAEDLDGSSGLRSPPKEPCAMPFKMLRPCVVSGMIQGADESTHGVDACDVRAFGRVAVVAGKGKVRLGRGAEVFECGDVIRLKRQLCP
jgi:hypothetical protein